MQGIKRGVMELADVVGVNKADGPLEASANHTAADYRHALHLVRPKWPGVETPVVTCSALTNDGLDELWSTIEGVHERLQTEGHLAALRSEQAVAHMGSEFEHLLAERVFRLPAFDKLRERLEAEVRDGKRSPSSAAAELARRAWRELGAL